MTSRLWEYVARGQLTDLTPLVSRQAGRVFWVPGVDEVGGRRVGRLVVTERLRSDDSWLPAGVYADRWAPREETTPLHGQPVARAAGRHRSVPQLRAAVTCSACRPGSA